MKIKTRKFEVLEVEDLERAVSKTFGQECRIGQMDVVLFDTLYSVFFTVHVDGCTAVFDGFEEDKFCSFDLDDDSIDWSRFGTERSGFDEEYIFDFDTALFKSYKRVVDSDALEGIDADDMDTPY